MSFLAQDSRNYKARVHDRNGTPHIRTMGTTVKAEADAIETWCKRLRTQGNWRVLEKIVDRQLSAREAYHALMSETLTTLLDSLERRASEDADADLDPLVTTWAKKARGQDYVRQVRSLIIAGHRFPVSTFTRRRLSEHLAALPVNDPTRNRYRGAFLQFARWLVEMEILDSNPVRDVSGYREHDPRMIHYARAEVQALVQRLPMPQQVGEAFMAGAGMELGAVLALHRRDVNLDTRRVMAHGTKTRWRQREVKVTEDWCWAIIAPYVRGFTPDAKLFPRVVPSVWLRTHKRACKAAEIAVSTLHDHRHTYSVQKLKDGLAPQTIKRQLGHAPKSTELERVYSVWLPKTDADYEPQGITLQPMVSSHG